MKIIVLDAYNAKVEIVEVDDVVYQDLGAGQILEDLGISVENVSYFVAPIDGLPVTITKAEYEFGSLSSETRHYLLKDSGKIIEVD